MLSPEFQMLKNKTVMFTVMCCFLLMYRVAQKSEPPPIFQKNALKIANEIRFLRKVKV